MLKENYQECGLQQQLAKSVQAGGCRLRGTTSTPASKTANAGSSLLSIFSLLW